jgi:hypothetical protein
MLAASKLTNLPHAATFSVECCNGIPGYEVGLALCGSREELVPGNKEPTPQWLLLLYDYNLKQHPKDYN